MTKTAHTAPPRGTDAMKAVLTVERFNDPNWVFERKLDGIRCIAVRDRASLRLLSRNDLPLGLREDKPAELVVLEA